MTPPEKRLLIELATTVLALARSHNSGMGNVINIDPTRLAAAIQYFKDFEAVKDRSATKTETLTERIGRINVGDE